MSVSVVTIVGVFSLVSPPVVTIHPRVSTKTRARAQVDAYKRTGALLSNRADRTHTYHQDTYDIDEGLGRRGGWDWAGTSVRVRRERYTGRRLRTCSGLRRSMR